MTALRLRQITALGGNDYELEFEGDAGETGRMRAVVFEQNGVHGVEVEPDLFMSGQVGNARAVTAAVIACHQARATTPV
jgi:hypothetical protein